MNLTAALVTLVLLWTVPALTTLLAAFVLGRVTARPPEGVVEPADDAGTSG